MGLPFFRCFLVRTQLTCWGLVLRTLFCHWGMTLNPAFKEHSCLSRVGCPQIRKILVYFAWSKIRWKVNGHGGSLEIRKCPFKIWHGAPFPCFNERVKIMFALDQHLWGLAKGQTKSPAGCWVKKGWRLLFCSCLCFLHSKVTPKSNI